MMTIPTPLWLTDTDYPAPCPCGRPFLHGEPLIMAVGEHGLKRLMHARCISGGMVDDDEQA